MKFILTVFLGNLASRGLDEKIGFNVLYAIETFAVGIQFSVGMPRIFAIFLGTIFVFIPAILFYLFGKGLYKWFRK